MSHAVQLPRVWLAALSKSTCAAFTTVSILKEPHRGYCHYPSIAAFTAEPATGSCRRVEQEVREVSKWPPLLGVERVGLGAQTAGSRGVLLEEAAEGGSEERAEDEIGAPESTVSLTCPSRN